MMRKRWIGVLLALCLVWGMTVPAAARESAATVTKMVHHENIHGAILSDHSLWIWGYGANTRFIDGTTAPEPPTKVLEQVEDLQIFHGFGNTFAALGTDGSLWMWGANDSGQLGDGTTEFNGTPQRVLDNVSYVKMVPRLWYAYGNGISPNGKQVYGTTTIALCQDGSLWMWGGVLMGYAPFASSEEAASGRPVKVMDGVSSFEINNQNLAIVRTDGSLWMWGQDDRYGQLGIGTAMDSTQTQGTVQPPQKVLDEAESVAMTGSAVFALSPSGTLWQWGRVPFETDQYVEDKGSSSYTTSSYYSPVPVRVMENVSSLTAMGIYDSYFGYTESYAVALQAGGSLWTQNYDYYEDPEGMEQANQTQYGWYRALTGVGKYELTVSSANKPGISAIGQDGSLWMWGWFDGTSISRGDRDLSYYQPEMSTEFPLYIHGDIASVHGGLILGKDGRLWRVNHLMTEEELKEYDDPPVRLEKLLDQVKSVETSQVAGRNYYAAICRDGSLWMWGNNAYGQLGTGNCENAWTPVKVMEDVSAVSLANYDYSETAGSVTYIRQEPKTYVVRGDGSFCAFGCNVKTQLGVRTPDSYSALPVKVTFEEPYTPYRPSTDGWGFTNGNAIVNIPTTAGEPDENGGGNKVISDVLWKKAMGSGLKSDALYLIQKKAVNGGLCWGMAVASALTYLDLPDAENWQEEAQSASNIRHAEQTQHVNGMNLLEYLEVLWAYQFRSEIQEEMRTNKWDMRFDHSYQAIVDLTRHFEETGEDPIALVLTDDFGGEKTGHVLIPYKVEENGADTLVYVYDCNSAAGEASNEAHVTFTGTDGRLTEWSYLWKEENGKKYYVGSKITDADWYGHLTYIEDLEDHAVDILGIDLPKKHEQYLEYFLFMVPSEGRKDIYTYYDYVEAVIECSGGKVNEATPSSFISILTAFGEQSDVEKSPYLFYVPQDEPAFTLRSQDDTPIEATLAGDDTALTVCADRSASVEIAPCEGNFSAEVTPSGGEQEIRFSCTFAGSEGDTEILVTGVSDLRAGIRMEKDRAEFHGFRSATVTITAQEKVSTAEIGSGSYVVSREAVSSIPVHPELETIDRQGDQTIVTVSGVPAEGAQLIAASYAKNGKCLTVECRIVLSDCTERLPLAGEEDGTITVFLLSNDGKRTPLCQQKSV